MEYVTSNFRQTKARRVVLNGRPWLVAPVTMIVPGVLNGSKGALYYPPEEVEADPQAWDGFPIVVYHPRTQASARDPEVHRTQWVGNVYRTRVGNGKLVAEAWFDEEATQRVDRRVYDALVAGRRMEVSTGLHTVNFPAPPGSTHNGRGYEYVARQYRPDHLAILPDQVGACSLKDGCGLMVANRTQVTNNCHCGGTCGKCGDHGAENALASSRLDMTPEKACKILKDGKVHGKRLTKKQRGLFGVRCGERDSAAVNRDFSERRRHELAGSGKALPDGSFPIVTAQDLRNAILAYGRASDPEAAKAHIKKRAKALGLGSLLPDTWNTSDVPGVVWNWCNQYGGTTCKDKSRNTKARRRAARKAPAVKPVPPKSMAGGKAKVKKTIKVKKVVAPPPGKPLPAKGTKVNQYSHWQSAGGDVVRATSTLEKLTGDWVNLAKAGKRYPSGQDMEAQVDEALGKADPRAVARQLGLVQKFTKAKAKAKLYQITRDRPGMVARSMV